MDRLTKAWFFAGFAMFLVFLAMPGESQGQYAATCTTGAGACTPGLHVLNTADCGTNGICTQNGGPAFDACILPGTSCGNNTPVSCPGTCNNFSKSPCNNTAGACR